MSTSNPALPPELTKALYAAGYKLDDDFSEALGVIAVDAAVAIARAAGNLGGTGSTASKVGRNDPCPCGSGKKYKRCCLGSEPATAAPAETPGPTPFETPELIPCLDSPEGWAAGGEGLEALMLADADLRAVRFDELAVQEYLVEHADELEAAHAGEEPEGVDLVLETLATRFARTVDKMATLKRLARTLREVAPRYRTDVSALRGLATGLAFAELPANDEDLPLATTLFQLASYQPRHDVELVQQVLAPDNDDLVDLLWVAGSEQLAVSRDTVADHAEASAALERLITRAEAFEGVVEKLITAGRFPVAVPFCVWIVMQQRTRQAAEAGGDGGAAEPLADGESEWLRVAAEVYGDRLGAWLEGRPESPLGVRGAVRWLASQLVDFGFTRVSLQLLLRGINHKWVSFLPGENELLGAHAGLDGVLGDGLPAYRAFLTEAGYGDLAEQLQTPETVPPPP